MYVRQEVRGIGKIQDTGHLKGTRHETEVKAITEALSRLNQSCEVHIHCEDTYVVNIIDIFLPGWAGNGFKTAKRETCSRELADTLEKRCKGI